MKLTGVSLNGLPKTVRELGVLMAHRPQYLFRAYRTLSAVLVLGVLSALLYLWVFSKLSHAQPAWTFLLGFIAAGLSALVVQVVFTQDESAFMRKREDPRRAWDGFSILIAFVTLPAYLFAHAVRFQHLIRTKFPDPKKDVRYALFESFFQDIFAWNRCVPSLNQFLFVSQSCGGRQAEQRVSDQLAVLQRHEAALRHLADRLHGELVARPIGTVTVFSAQATDLESDLFAWKQQTERLIPGLFVSHFYGTS